MLDLLCICCSMCLCLCAVALPPPSVLDEETPVNYFNLDPSTSPAVMNIALPPPPGINPPPPGKIRTLISCIQLTYIKNTKTLLIISQLILYYYY